MQRANPIPWNTVMIEKMIDKGTIVFDNPFQRPYGQWNNDQESLLIHSVFTYFITDVYAIREERMIGEKMMKVYDMIDGQHRLKTLARFRKNEIKLTKLKPFIHESTGEEYDVSDMYYCDLPDELRAAYDQFTLTARPVELDSDDDKEELSAELSYRLNNGIKWTNSHLAIVSAKPATRDFIQGNLHKHPLFTVTAHFAKGSVKNSEPQMTLMQALALVGEYEWTTFGHTEMKKLFASRDVEQDIFDSTQKAFDMINDAFPVYTKFINKTSLPAIIKLIVNNNFNENLIDFLQEYSKTMKKGDDYLKYTGEGGTKKTKVEGRVNGLQSLYEKFDARFTVDSPKKDGEGQMAINC